MDNNTVDNKYIFENYFCKELIDEIKSFVIQPGPKSKTPKGYKKIVHKYYTEFVPLNQKVVVTPTPRPKKSISYDEL